MNFDVSVPVLYRKALSAARISSDMVSRSRRPGMTYTSAEMDQKQHPTTVDGDAVWCSYQDCATCKRETYVRMHPLRP